MEPKPRLVIDAKSDLTLRVWLLDQIRIDRPEGAVHRLELRHLPDGSKAGHEVATFSVPLDPPDIWFDDTVDAIDGAAVNDANGIQQGVQRYTIVVYRMGDPKKAQARFTFRKRSFAEDDEVENYGASEPATNSGITKMLMRHLEVQARTTAAGAGSVMRAQHNMIQNLHKVNEQLLSQRLQDFSTVEELLTMKHDRDIKALEVQASIERKDKLADNLKLLAPVIVNRVAGKNLMPVTDPKLSAIKGLVENLDEEQRKQLMGILTPQQLGVLMEVIQDTNGE